MRDLFDKAKVSAKKVMYSFLGDRGGGSHCLPSSILIFSSQGRAPCIIFIDEIDSVGAKRVSNGIHPYANQTINQLLRYHREKEYMKLRDQL